MKGLSLIFILFVVLWGCTNKNDPNATIDSSLKLTKDLVIPNSFNFESFKQVSVGILVKNPSTILSGVPVSIYLDYPGTTESLNMDARLIGTYLSKENGRIDEVIKLSASQDSLYLKTAYAGIESESGFKIEGLTATYTYGEGNTLKSAALIDQGKIVDMNINLKVRAIGAYYHDGFGIQLPVASSTVSQVLLRDQSYHTTSISLEAGQTLATVIAFDDAYKLLPSTGGVIGVNVIPGNGYRTPHDIQLHLIFSTPQAPAAIGSPPYNPFVIVDGDRSKEIHMVNSKPTAMSSPTFFGQADDASKPATSTYYKSRKNLIWMMEVPSSFSYDIEKKDITKAYLNFGGWAESEIGRAHV